MNIMLLVDESKLKVGTVRMMLRDYGVKDIEHIPIETMQVLVEKYFQEKQEETA